MKREASRAAVIAAVLTVPVLVAGCIETPFGNPDFLVIVSAPKAAGGLTVFMATEKTLVPGDRTAEFDIRYGDTIVYPPGGSGAQFTLEDDGAAVFVPYSLFVVGNGEYEVRVRHGGDELKARASITKWVNYVFLHPFDRGNKIQVDAQLSRTTGGLPSDRVLAEGELVLELHYRGVDGGRDKFLAPPLKVVTDSDTTFTRIDIPRGRFSEGAGYYSVEPVFHNSHAKGNLWVPADPTMADRNPPWNWIYLSR